jgi:hypothetical protein
MPDLIEDDYRITEVKYEALNNDFKQRVNNAIHYDKSLGKTFTYWKKGMDVMRMNPIKNADIKDAEALQKHITNRKSRKALAGVDKYKKGTGSEKWITQVKPRLPRNKKGP